MAINPKNFIEFFKREFNVDFIDIETGRNLLDIIRENEKAKNCLNCRWMAHGDGVYSHEEDTYCINRDSEYVTEYVNRETVCNFWESKGDLDE